MSLARFLVVAGACVALIAGVAQAQVPVLAGKSWTSLSAQQQDLLAPLATQWPQMNAEQRDTFAALALRYPQLDAPAQQRLRERLQDWARLSAGERQRVYQGFLAAQRLAPDERQSKWQAYQALSPEQRQALQERAAARRVPKAASAAGAGAAPQRPLQASSEQLHPQTLLPRRPQP